MTKNFDTIHMDAPVKKAIKKILHAKVRSTGHKTDSLMVVDDVQGLVGTISHLRPSYLNYGIDGNELNWKGEVEEYLMINRSHWLGGALTLLSKEDYELDTANFIKHFQ